MKNKRTYYRDAKGRFSSKPLHEMNIYEFIGYSLKLTSKLAMLYKFKKSNKEIDYTNPDNNEMNY
jgi:hypothetical protein